MIYILWFTTMSINYIKVVPPIPLNNIPAPWKQAIKELNQVPPPLPFCSSPIELNENMPDTDERTVLYFVGKDKSNLKPKISILPTLAKASKSGNELSNYTLQLSLLNQPTLQLHADMLDADWRIELYLLVKKLWNDKLEVPVSRKLAKLYEPGSNLLCQLVQLCTSCFESKHHLTKPYKHAADWFSKIIQEAKKLDTKITIANKAKGKAPVIDEMREIVDQMRDGKNPVSEKTSPHYYRLIEVALSLNKLEVGLSLNKISKLNRSHWKAFISSCCQRIQAIEKPTCQETFVKDKKLVCRVPGPGRRTYLLLKI
ncbi:hypothetical protein [Nostoc sp. 2RC]|uniref:hypothetical protein n=1 Tax=Nostoc sp. 2RC TaxID=2485484 RepID=UPI001627B361|nr:hypothetical protein [Nostoc sp. 2RC]MBC1238353.1 hypothetical protein [Nostoc sp. 2RC]